MRLNTITVPDWPRQAWVAVCGPSEEVTCYVGPQVESGNGWCCEAVWDAPFGEGGFDETDLVFGSGVRARDDHVTFVTAGSTVDRLYSLPTDDGPCVSNSLAGLLAFTGGSLHLTYQRYWIDFSTLRLGIRRYQREHSTTAGTMRVACFNNFLWDGTSLREVEKPCANRDLGSYAKYREFLDGSMERISANARATGRGYPYDLVSTLSSGYDSSTATVLARQVGCTEAVGFDRCQHGEADSGARTAEALGLEYHGFETATAPKADLLFHAAGVGHGGDALFKAAEAHLAGRVVFAGFFGDKVWGLDHHDLEGDLPRDDTAGMDMSEYRLSLGFVTCAVPYWGGRQIRDIRTIGMSAELEPWSVGGRYDRPICRRIVEEAGVPRDAFGIRKRGVFHAPPSPSSFLTPELRNDYYRWLRSKRSQFARHRMIPPTPLGDALTSATGRFRTGFDPDRRRRLHRYVVHWAVERAGERYPDPRR